MNRQEKYDGERKQQANKRKKMVLDDARELFIKSGISRVTMNMIMDEAQVSRATLYRYYKDIHQIAMDVQKDILNNILQDIKPTPVRDEHPIRLVQYILLGMIEGFDRNREGYKYISMFNHTYVDQYPSDESQKDYLQYMVELFMDKENICLSAHSIIASGYAADIYEHDDEKILKLYYENWDPLLVDEEYQINTLLASYDIAFPVPYEKIQVGSRKGIIFQKLHSITMQKKCQRNR